MRRLLIVSLIANVFLIAYVGAGWVAAYSGAPSYFTSALPSSHVEKQKRRRGFDREAALAALDEPSRKKALQIWQRHGEDLPARLDEYRSLRRNLRKMLSSEQVDAAALDKALGELARMRIENQARLHKVLSDLVAELPADQRLKYFQAGRGNRHGNKNR